MSVCPKADMAGWIYEYAALVTIVKFATAVVLVAIAIVLFVNAVIWTKR
jgi:hypothetical protein